MVASITVSDEQEGFKTVFYFEGGFNNESKAHIIVKLLESHLATIAHPLSDPEPSD